MAEKTKSSKQGIWISAGIIVFILVASWFWRAPDRQIPANLVGTWRTTDPNFSDRWFDIDPAVIDFGTGGADVSVGFIKEIKTVSDGGRTLYTISYLVDGAPNEVSFYYESNGTIRFQHQEKTAWTKSE